MKRSKYTIFFIEIGLMFNILLGFYFLGRLRYNIITMKKKIDIKDASFNTILHILTLLTIGIDWKWVSRQFFVTFSFMSDFLLLGYYFVDCSQMCALPSVRH